MRTWVSELLERLMGSTKLWGRRVGLNRFWNGTMPYILVFHPDRVEVQTLMLCKEIQMRPVGRFPQRFFISFVVFYKNSAGVIYTPLYAAERSSNNN
jgi:hypothetical protein